VRKPESDISRELLASVYGHLGDIKKSEKIWNELSGLNPDHSIEHRRRVLPYKNPSDFEHIIEGLRKAGLGLT
jgi:adenylate cyclase